MIAILTVVSIIVLFITYVIMKDIKNERYNYQPIEESSNKKQKAKSSRNSKVSTNKENKRKYNSTKKKSAKSKVK